MAFRGRTQLATVPIGAPTASIEIGDPFLTGAAGVAADAGHQHAMAAPAAGYVTDVGSLLNDGGLTAAARADHAHRLQTLLLAPGGGVDLSGIYARRGATTDAVQYVAVGGNDTQDGLSIGSAKATVAAGIAALPAAGGTVRIGKGTFTVAAQINLPSNVRLIGEGREATILQQGFALPASVDGNAMIRNADQVNGNPGIAVEDLQILCTPLVLNGGGGIAQSTFALQFNGVSDSAVRRCKILNGAVSFGPLVAVANTATVHATGKNNRNVVVDSHLEAGSEAIAYMQGTDLTVAFCRMVAAYDSTLSINSSGERITLVGNIVDKQGRAAPALANFEFTNDSAGDAAGIRDVNMTGNTLLSNHYAAGDSGDGIQLSKVDNFVISGNVIRDNQGAGIQVIGSHHGVITGNSIQGNQSHGIYITTGQPNVDLVIVGNDTSNNAGVGACGIAIAGGGTNPNNIVIALNTACNNAADGIATFVGATNGLIGLNIVTGNGGLGVHHATIAGWVSRGNIGFNPQGASALAVGASPWTYTNGDAVPEVVHIRGGTVTAITKDGQTIATATAAATPVSVPLEPGEAVIVTYTVAPTVVKDQK